MCACVQVCVWVGWEGIPRWLALRSHKASTAYHMQHSPYSLHRKTDFTATSHQMWWCVACGEKWLCSLRSDFYFSKFIQHSLQVSSRSEPAVTSQGKIRLSGRRVEDVEGKNEEKGWRLFFFFKQKKGFLRFEVRFMAVCAYVMSELKTPCFSGRLILNVLWEVGE